MTTQPQMFPPTLDELLAQYRRRLESDVERAATRASKAIASETEAMEALAAFDAAIAAQAATGDGTGTALPVFTETDIAQWSQEVAETPPPEHTKTCPACEGDGRPFCKF